MDPGSSHLHLLPLPRRSSGHTLVELVVTLSILMLMIGIPLGAFGRVLSAAESRGASQAVQGVLAEAQVETLQLGGRHVVSIEEGVWTHTRTILSTGSGAEVGTSYSDAMPPLVVGTNVGRWLDGSVVRISFAGWFAAPDSAGSVYLGEEAGGSRVVVRAATGFTRRERR